MKCPYCGSQLGRNPGAFCAYCGEKLPEMQGAALEKHLQNRNTGSRIQEEELRKQMDAVRQVTEEKPRKESWLGSVLIVLISLALLAGFIWVCFGDGMDTVSAYLEETGIFSELDF